MLTPNGHSINQNEKMRRIRQITDATLSELELKCSNYHRNQLKRFPIIKEILPMCPKQKKLIEIYIFYIIQWLIDAEESLRAFAHIEVKRP